MTSLTGSIECSIAVSKRYLSVIRFCGCVGLETEYVVLLCGCVVLLCELELKSVVRLRDLLFFVVRISNSMCAVRISNILFPMCEQGVGTFSRVRSITCVFVELFEMYDSFASLKGDILLLLLLFPSMT